MPEHLIAPAGQADCGRCADLLVTQLAEHGVEVSQEGLLPVLQRVVADRNLGFLLVARMDSRIVGVAYSATLLSAEHCGFVGSLEELYVAPDCRNAGIGTALLKAVFDEAHARGLVAIELEVDIDHHRVESLYRRFGFRRLDRSRWLKTLSFPEAVSRPIP
jgi:ribosomal protein S18 acetylase RimI-like enzyme